jgi:hypothetical protein
MRTFWRGRGNDLHTHADWRNRLDKKNRRQGTSAPTLAAVWAGPVELFGALGQQDALRELTIDEICVEAQSPVDEFSGDRNHDLVIRGRLRDESRVVVCVEAKAGEDLGATVAQQSTAAHAALSRAETTASRTGKKTTSNAPARLQGLLERFVPYPPSEPRVQRLRYQLLTALAGTLGEAKTSGARHAVLMMHEFLTDERDNEHVIRQHDRDVWEFCTTVFDFEPPGREVAPWCVEVPQLPEAPELALYLARAITDLRTATLEPTAMSADD